MTSLDREVAGRSRPEASDQFSTAESSYGEQRGFHIFVQPVVIAFLATALSYGVLYNAELLAPATRWTLATPLCFAVALEAVLTTNWLRRPERIGENRLAYRLAEVALIVLAARLYSLLIFEGGLPSAADLGAYLRSPLSFLAQGPFLVTTLFALAAWLAGVSVGATFTYLALSVTEAAYYSEPDPGSRHDWYDAPLHRDRGALVSVFMRQWLTGGIVLALCTGLSTLDLRQVAFSPGRVAIARLGIQPLMLASLLLYLLAGFWLLSQARLAVMNARWLTGGFRRSRLLGSSWRRSSLLVLLLVALLAAFLPIGSTVAFSQVVGVLLAGLLFASSLLFALVSYLFLAFMSLLAFLFGGATGTAEETLPARPQLEELVGPQATPAAAGNEFIGMVFSSLLWAVIIVAAAMAALYFLRDRGVPVEPRRAQAWLKERLRGLWRRLRALWFGAASQAAAVGATLRRQIVNRLPAGPSPGAPWRFIRLNALSPRDRVRYFYLSTIKRAGQRGLDRRPDSTPSEFTADLRREWPEVDEEIEGLTTAFLDARYSAHEITGEDVHPAKEQWQRLRRFLRRAGHRRSPPEDEEPRRH